MLASHRHLTVVINFKSMSQVQGQARFSYFLRVLGFEQEIQTAELDYQLVKQTTEWRAPARFDQVLEISVSTKHLGTTSFTLATEFRIAGEEALIATSETVYVHVDAHTLKKAPIPTRLREALERGAAGKTVDHAGYR